MQDFSFGGWGGDFYPSAQDTAKALRQGLKVSDSLQLMENLPCFGCQGDYLKKIGVLFLVNFYLDKYSLYNYWTQSFKN